MSLIDRRDGYYDENGHWQRTKFCFVPCGATCTCGPPNGQWTIPVEKDEDNEMTTRNAQSDESNDS